MPLAEFDGTGTLKRVFLYASHDVPVALLEGTETYHIVTDHLGSPRLVVDDSGSIVKRIGCMPGGKLVKAGYQYYCDGHFLGRAQEIQGHRPFDFSGIVPPGMVFLVGDKDTSYDSRYFGFKPLNDIETVLLPLL